jgi:hypothetical protein
LAFLGLSDKSIRLVIALTHDKNQPHADYITQVIEAGPDAMRIKVADLLHNTRHDRMEALDHPTRRRLEAKYRPAMARLLYELDLIP